MNAVARFWRGLPFPVQILLGIVGGLAVFQLFSHLGWLLVVLAVLFWVLVLAGLGYALGWLRPAGPPLLVTALVRLTGQPSQPPPSPAPLDQAVERERLLPDVTVALGELRGEDRPLQQLSELVETVKAQRSRGASGFGTDAPGVVILITGPRGVGKSSLARQIGPLFCGLGAIPNPNTVTAGPAELSPRLGGSMIERVRALAERALDAVLLLEDMDWMVTGDASGLAAGADLGPTLTAVAQASPGRLLVVMTMSSGAADRLQKDPERGAWLRKLLDRRIDFDALPPEVLVDLLKAQIERRRHQLLPAAEKLATRLLKQMVQGVDFDNATAVRRLADDLMQHAAARSAQAPYAPDNPYTITETDVRACE